MSSRTRSFSQAAMTEDEESPPRILTAAQLTSRFAGVHKSSLAAPTAPTNISLPRVVSYPVHRNNNNTAHNNIHVHNYNQHQNHPGLSNNNHVDNFVRSSRMLSSAAMTPLAFQSLSTDKIVSTLLEGFDAGDVDLFNVVWQEAVSRLPLEVRHPPNKQQSLSFGALQSLHFNLQLHFAVYPIVHLLGDGFTRRCVIFFFNQYT